MSIVSEDLITTGNSFHIVDAASEKARLPIFSLLSETKSYLETDDLRVLQISENVAD